MHLFQFLFAASVHSAPGATVSNWNGNQYFDSDSTGPDQSDVPPYEWDDYKVN